MVPFLCKPFLLPCPSPGIDPGKKLLCRNTFISAMKAAELWNGDNLSHR
jgi:hypothetical protein